MHVHGSHRAALIDWPPPVVASVRPFEKLPVASEVRQAILQSASWGEDDDRAWIDMRLEYHGDTVSASLVGGRRQRGGLRRGSSGHFSVASARRSLRSRTSKSLRRRPPNRASTRACPSAHAL